uniref:Uncharacterized protein n=1 Tax=Setaria viridis TaxID=4556 RepID=A0A4U6VG62_SETVI|nr:hypothetical protein SEVIR_3G335200v2 [Setaria viridis]
MLLLGDGLLFGCYFMERQIFNGSAEKWWLSLFWIPYGCKPCHLHLTALVLSTINWIVFSATC